MTSDGTAEPRGVQYRLVTDEGDQIVGPADADAAPKVVLTVAADALDDAGGDATVAYMRGALKAVGDTGVILAVLRDGTADRVFADLSRDA